MRRQGGPMGDRGRLRFKVVPGSFYGTPKELWASVRGPRTARPKRCGALSPRARGPARADGARSRSRAPQVAGQRRRVPRHPRAAAAWRPDPPRLRDRPHGPGAAGLPGQEPRRAAPLLRLGPAQRSPAPRRGSRCAASRAADDAGASRNSSRSGSRRRPGSIRPTRSASIASGRARSGSSTSTRRPAGCERVRQLASVRGRARVFDPNPLVARRSGSR